MSASNTRRRRRSAIRKSTRAVNTSQAHGQKSRTRIRRRAVGPAITTVHRTSRLLRPDMRVRYAYDVTRQSVDREAWAAVVAQLITQETGGNKTRFAALVGVTYKTILRWLNRESDVSEESVRQVARAVHISPLELLVRVGYYDAAELGATTDKQVVTGDDPALRAILEADVPPRIKQRMIQRLYQLREREVEEVQWWIDQAKEG